MLNLDYIIRWVLVNPRTFIASIASLCLLFIYLLSVVPFVDAAKIKSERETEYQNYSENYSEVQQILSSENIDDNQYQASENKVNAWMPNKLSQTQLTQHLADFSQRNNVQLSDFKFVKTTNTLGFSINTYEIVARGRLNFLYRFIQELPASKPLIEVARTVFRPLQSGNGELLLTIRTISQL